MAEGPFRGPYRLVRQLAEGSMSVLYEAVDIRSQATVALKTLTPAIAQDPWKVACLKREYQYGKGLRHPNLVRFIEFFSIDGTDHLVMEYVAGETLRDAIDAGKLRPAEKMEISKGIGMALAHIHDRYAAEGLVHADLKPENILLRHRAGPIQRDDVVLIDFGTVVVHESRGSLRGWVKKRLWSLFGGQRIMGGSPVYMSPEQSRADFIDQRSDIYSLGVVLYDLFTGRPPFLTSADEERSAAGKPLKLKELRLTDLLHSDYNHELTIKHNTLKPVPPRERAREIPPALNTLILKCLQKNPSRRYKSALAVLLALNNVPVMADGSFPGGTGGGFGQAASPSLPNTPRS